MVREVSASGQGRPEVKGGKQSRHLEKEHSSQREGQVYWLGQKLMQRQRGGARNTSEDRKHFPVPHYKGSGFHFEREGFLFARIYEQRSDVTFLGAGFLCGLDLCRLIPKVLVIKGTFLLTGSN